MQWDAAINTLFTLYITIDWNFIDDYVFGSAVCCIFQKYENKLELEFAYYAINRKKIHHKAYGILYNTTYQ